jgi:tetratricopeptide (TPR) repeat protein
VGARATPGVGSEAWWEGLLVSEKKGQTLADAAKSIFEKGLAAAGEGKYDEAIGILENINQIHPALVASALQTGRCHWEMHRWEPARKYFELAQRLDPTNDDTGWTLGLLSLQMGDFKAGWEGYERRWGSKTFSSPRISTIHPQWERGLGLKRPIVWTEQGIGDQILYASLIEALAKEVDSVVVLIDMRLAPLLQRGCKAENVTFLPHNAKIKMADHDSHIPIASMGKYFINNVRDILPTRSESYIKADPHRVGLLKKEYGLENKRIIGLSWASTAPAIGEHKSVGLEGFKSLFDIPETVFINLQYGKPQDEAKDFHPNLITTHIDTFLDLENVAALMELCDVIVSPSNANVHLAAAMGKPVQLLDANKLWYWNNRKGYRSLWYPEVRIFQRENMNAPWDLQVRQVKEELERMYMMRTPVVNHFAFFHVGDDISQPQKMVKSLLRHNPDAFITMYTDKTTPDVMGITRRVESEVNREELCYHRIKAYAEIYVSSILPTMYLDTDMLVQDKIVVKDLLEQHKNVTFLRREFQRDAIFNVDQRGINFSEYEGKTIDEVYPYVGCTIVAKNPQVWKDLLAIYDTLDPKFRKWYGDQEALRIYAKKYPERVSEVNESVYGCLPEHKTDDAKILHFKGEARKKLFEVA